MLRQVIGLIPLLIWLYLLTARGRFWWPRAHRVPRLPPVAPRKVVVVIPARNEAELIATAVDSLLRQEFAGHIELIVVDDGSTDGTAAAAQAAAAAAGAPGRLTLIAGRPVPARWTGKLWALAQGVSTARQRHPNYLLLTDADIVHGADSVASLVAEAESFSLDLVSHMVRLSVLTVAERLLIPAFVFFFFKLYPPRWVRDPERHTAAAAGGCILIRPEALARAGGLEAIASSIIDDCALARAVKRSGGRLSLRLASHSRSLRSYRSSREIGTMVSRTAFAQLRHSYLLLTATVLGLFITYLLPVFLLLTPGLTAGLGFLTCLLMSLCYLPTVRFYRLAPFWSLFLPVISLFYIAATLYSALQYTRGRGGEWKGRVQDA